MSQFLSASEIELLRSNRPSPQEDHSAISRLLNPWWEWSARQVPAWVAPNALTVAGSLAMVLPTLLQLALSPTLSGPQPWWACLASLLGIFLFQTLDAIDGKQARRTRTSSPLGSWLDHALDILTMLFVFVGVCASLGMGINGVFCLVLATLLLNGWFLHWEVHHTRLLYLANGTSIAEAQLLCMGIHLVSALLGTGFWQQTLPGFALRYCDLLALVAVIGVGWSGMLCSIARARRAGAAWSALRQARGLLGMVLLLATAAFVEADSGTRLLYLLGISLLGSRLIGDQVLHNLLDRQPEGLQWPAVMAAALLAGHVAMSLLGAAVQLQFALALLCFAFCAVVTLGRLAVTACALADALRIRIFTI